MSIRPEPVGRLGLGLGLRLVLDLAVLLLLRRDGVLGLAVSLLAILLPLAVLRVAVLLIAVLLLRRLDWYRKLVVAVMQLRLPVPRHLLELPLLWRSSLSRRRRRLSREVREALPRRGHHWVVWEA